MPGIANVEAAIADYAADIVARLTRHKARWSTDC
jgi:hypothetical protein